jgi:hypothetical protein
VDSEGEMTGNRDGFEMKAGVRRKENGGRGSRDLESSEQDIGGRVNGYTSYNMRRLGMGEEAMRERRRQGVHWSRELEGMM